MLDKLYAGRNLLYGDIHEHAATGGTSDGKFPLEKWTETLTDLGMSFEAILDHHQVRHMYLEEFDKFCYLCGTEPGTRITDAKDIPDEEGNRRNVLHYNMLFRRKGELEKVLESFPEFEFEGGKEGHFVYPSFTRERFTQLKDMVTSMGGFFVHPHPCDLLKSDDCSEYVFGDFMGIEVFYISLEHRLSAPQYDLWLKILDKGHRVYACAGTDTHKLPTGLIVTTLYAGVLSRDEIVKLLHEGDFVCGNAGIRMCIGSTKMGGVRKLKDGDILEVSVGDIWQGTEGNVYRADIISRDGIEKSFDFTFGETKYMLIPAVKKGFYRVEVTDLSKDQKIALGNPIWTE